MTPTPVVPETAVFFLEDGWKFHWRMHPYRHRVWYRIPQCSFDDWPPHYIIMQTSWKVRLKGSAAVSYGLWLYCPVVFGVLVVALGDVSQLVEFRMCCSITSWTVSITSVSILTGVKVLCYGGNRCVWLSSSFSPYNALVFGIMSNSWHCKLWSSYWTRKERHYTLWKSNISLSIYCVTVQHVWDLIIHTALGLRLKLYSTVVHHIESETALFCYTLFSAFTTYYMDNGIPTRECRCWWRKPRHWLCSKWLWRNMRFFRFRTSSCIGGQHAESRWVHTFRIRN